MSGREIFGGDANLAGSFHARDEGGAAVDRTPRVDADRRPPAAFGVRGLVFFRL